MTTKVVGVTFDDRQEVLASIAKGDDELELVYLEHEPTNPYDKYAIAVRGVLREGEKVVGLGYLAKHTTELYDVVGKGVISDWKVVEPYNETGKYGMVVDVSGFLKKKVSSTAFSSAKSTSRQRLHHKK